MNASGLNVLNYVGPLRKNKNASTDDDPALDLAPFEFDRFKRHLTGVLERVSRMSAKDDQKTADIDETLAEEDDNIEAADSSTAPKPEESDWTFDVKQTMDVLPRLQNSGEHSTKEGFSN